ncbi:MAG: carbohydrate ABC transporter permease [Defluviitaleaceae bacterium]|nr:carbohydrate ABC transporter permease [Defluviitaleaceae bacterium]
MVQDKSTARRIFVCFNYVFLILLALLCILPMINLLAVSLSSRSAAEAGLVGLWPVHFTTYAYSWTMQNAEFFQALWVSIQRVGIAVPIQLFLTITAAYPLSKERSTFKHRPIFVAYFIIVMVFSGGLIPFFIVVSRVGLIDSIWALILPGAVNTWHIILMMNFFRGIPKELEEAAFIDGASHWRTMAQIYLPISLPSIATITLFIVVGHWNEWFHGIIFMNDPSNYPLQTYLRTRVVTFDPTMITGDREAIRRMMEVSNRTTNAAQVFIAMIPVLLIYPFLQRYFMSGLTIGSVKG